jgi:chemotaxis protein methyltransferase CheR
VNVDETRPGRPPVESEASSPLPEVRWRVAAVLADVPGAAADAVLLQLLEDTDYRVREEAVAVLVRRFSAGIAHACGAALEGGGQDLGRPAHAEVLARAGAPGRPALLDALSSESAGVRLASARSLPGLFVDAPTVAALEAAMCLESDDNVRAALLLALGRTARREALAPLLLELSSAKAWLRIHAIVALGEIGDPDVAPRLLPLLADPELRSAVLVALSRLDSPAPGEELARRAATAPPDALLIGALRRSASASAPETVARLASLWPGARETLLALLERPEVPLPERTDAAHLLARLDLTGAAAALTRLGPFEDEFDALKEMPAGRFREALSAAGESDEPEPSLALIESARTAAERDAVAGLISHVSPLVVCAALGSLAPGSTSVAALVALLAREDEPETRRAAAFALAREIESAPAESARACRNALLDWAIGLDRPGKAEAVAALARFTYTAAGAAVIAALASPRGDVRRSAAGAAGVRLDVPLGALQELLQDEDPTVRAAALRSLTRWAERGEPIPPVDRKDLMQHLADEPIVAAAAGAAVVAYAGRVRPRIAIEMLAQKGPVRRAAIEEIAALGDTAAADAVAFALPHEDPETARAVVRAMAHATAETAEETLAQALADARPEVREAAAETIAERGGRAGFGGPFADAVAAALAVEAVPSVVAAILRAVAVAGGPGSIRPLVRILTAEDSGEAADSAAEALARRYPDRVREIWATAPPRAARRLSKALAAGPPHTAPAEDLPESLFGLLADLVRRRTGLLLRPGLRIRVARSLAAEAAEAGSFVRLYAFLRELPTESELFGRLLDVAAGRTSSFFEDPNGLVALAEEIAPERLLSLGSRETFDVWCAGCGSGEEAYALAILLFEKGLLPGQRVHIHATDLSPDAIRRGRRRRYGPRSLRAVSEERRGRFFECEGNALFRVRDEVAGCVSFAARCVFDEPRGSALFDAVLCRNLLPRLEEAVRARAVQTLASFLKPGGYLLLGRHDGLAAAATPLGLVRLANDIAYRR